MKKRNKCVAALLAMAMLVGMTGCGNGTSGNEGENVIEMLL